MSDALLLAPGNFSAQYISTQITGRASRSRAFSAARALTCRPRRLRSYRDRVPAAGWWLLFRWSSPTSGHTTSALGVWSSSLPSGRQTRSASCTANRPRPHSLSFCNSTPVARGSSGRFTTRT